VHSFLDGADSFLRDAAVIARHQHRPLRERHEDRLVHLQLHRQLDVLEAGGFNIGF